MSYNDKRTDAYQIMINRTYMVSAATIGATAFTGKDWRFGVFIVLQGLAQFAYWNFKWPEKKD